MKILYIASGINLTFVVNELEAHEHAGWEVLPLVSCKPELVEKFSKVMAKWSKRAVYRPNFLFQILALFKELLIHPVLFWKCFYWLMLMFFRCPGEFFKAVYELTAACYFAGFARKFEAQHIHVHFASRSLSLGIMLSILTKLPVSCTVHAFDLFTRSSAGLKYRLIKCKFIAAISNFNIDYLRENCGQEIAELCHVIHCGIDVNRFCCVERVPQPGRILFVAKLSPKKGLEVAIEACEKLKEQGFDFLFEIVGNSHEKWPWYQKHLEELIGRYRLEDKVKLLGAIPNDQLMPLFSKASIFLMPCIKTKGNDMDGIPVAMMEATACRVPVVSTSISGIPELVKNGVNGWLVREKDFEQLAEVLQKAIVDIDKIKQFGEAGRQLILEEFCIEKNAAQLRHLINAKI